MEDWRLSFPEISDYEISYNRYPHKWFNEVLKTEEKQEDREYNQLMEALFFKGGTIPINENLPEEYTKKGLRMFHAIVSSWSPKHEHKEKVCGLILKSICKL